MIFFFNDHWVSVSGTSGRFWTGITLDSYSCLGREATRACSRGVQLDNNCIYFVFRNQQLDQIFKLTS